MTRKTEDRRPKPVELAGLRGRVARGPDEKGRYYWRFWRTQDGNTENLHTLWGTRSEAEQALAKLVAGVQVKDKRETIRDLLEFYMGETEQRADLSPYSIRVIRNTAKKLVVAIGDVLIERLDRLTLERWRDRRLRENMAPTTVRLELGVLRAAWRWGKEIGIVDRDLPTVRVRRGEPRRNRYTPSAGEVAAVLAQLAGWARLAVLLYAGTGARLGEIAKLTWGQVDLRRRVVVLRGKTGSRTVPLVDELVNELTRIKPGKPEDRVLACKEGSAIRIDLRIRTACKRAGVPVFPPGGLRRAAVQALYRSTDPSVAAAIVGHSPQVAMRNYRQVSTPEAAEALKRASLGISEAPKLPLKPSQA